MKELLLKRDPSSLIYGTPGTLTEGPEFIARTIERPWLNNQHGVSCIPLGTYIAKRVSLENHPHMAHSAAVLMDPTITTYFMLQDVPGRDAIFIHYANIMTDVEGCIGIGLAWQQNVKNGLPGVTNSREMFKSFMHRYEDENELQLTIE